MNRRLIALPLGMAVAGAAWGQARSADVIYTYRGATPLRAYRLGDECFIPIESVSRWGWTAQRNGDVAQVTAEGSTINVPARTVSGQSTIALRRAVSLLGAKSEWVATTDTLQVYAPLSDLVYANGRLGYKAPLAVKATGFVLSDPNRAIFDLEGARLPERLDLPPNVRATQYRPYVVRIAVELPYVPLALGPTGTEGRQATLELRPADLPRRGGFRDHDRSERTTPRRVAARTVGDHDVRGYEGSDDLRRSARGADQRSGDLR